MDPRTDRAPEVPVEAPLLYATTRPDGHVYYRNEAWAALFGPSPTPWTCLDPEDQRLMAACLREASAGKMVSHQILRVASPQHDEPVPLLLHAFPMPAPDAPPEAAPAGIALMGEVLAEPASWVAQQTRRERLALLGHMTMGIAHDFNNLLSAILGHIELMENHVQGARGTTGLDEHLRPLKQATLDGAGIVRKLQRYIRNEKQVDHTPLQLDQLVQDTIALTRPYWYNDPRRHGIAIEVQFEPPSHALPAILGNATELREVLVNLTLNAIQAMPEGGTLTYSVASHRAEAGQSALCLSVQDTGIGMTPEVQRRLFDPLFTTKGESGNGMGLSVSKGILREHGGAITVESIPGHGTTFHLIFPTTTVQHEADPQGEADLDRRPAHLLVVDDEDKVRSVLTKLLHLKGYDVTPAASGPEAQALAAQQSFDLVITDHAMPEMEGRVLARYLRSTYPSLPIVLLTGDTDVGTKDDTLDLVLAKPFKIDDLDDALQQLLQDR
ncbi:MAG: ATP-binding protein [Bacteroidota bacterium]